MDVFHGGHWINIDDTKTAHVKNDHVLSYLPPRVPYLLFYRRFELTNQNPMNHLNNVDQSQRRPSGGSTRQQR